MDREGKMNREEVALRLTGLYMLRRQWAARATVCLGHCASLHSHGKPPPHFGGPGNAAHFLVRATKTSYTADPLSAIPP
ncbi:hypothetical protein Holit_02856 [Hollandina sp. SP2]